MGFAAMRSIFRTAFIWGCVGVAVAVFFLGLSQFTHALAYVELVFWPGSFAFMALDNTTTTRVGWAEGTAFLVATNFLLYFLVGLILTSIRRAWLRRGSQVRSGAPS